MTFKEGNQPDVGVIMEFRQQEAMLLFAKVTINLNGKMTR